MTEKTSAADREGTQRQPPYDRRRLSYANTFPDPVKANVIRTLEWLTGKLTLLRLIRRFERSGILPGQAFWGDALRHMGIEVRTPAEQIARIPRDGPLVVVANHPHGLIDGIVLAELVGRVRTDYKILTRSLLTGVRILDPFTIPVPFPHEPDAQKRGLAMRAEAMAHLAGGGAIVLFPSGSVAASARPFGPAVEAEWNPFTAKLVQRSGAAVLPIYFPGQNSRWYQLANQVSPTLRQGLLIHEVVNARNRPQAPVVGHPILPEEIARWRDRPRDFVRWLRETTLALG
ncbi:lysophospholipid acyltransferase family protein [Roseitranquillus sediminis]|uniref:lysophospholipid acyltransferase family protein n=1 Tax=Roseitranquillus sediminis TaxID=2809051 RepID=UPI001D0CADE0|nr:lysophospholipid acyltransferase family protein [Roseitranquillus sediminis]